jgi:hypothetical protein
MTTKESLHEIIETFDDEQAEKFLEYVEELARSWRRENVDATSRGPSDEGHDPLLDLIGMVRSSEPTDVAEFKDEYIADAFHLRDGSDT